MTDESLQLALQILQEELEDLEDQQKGKQAAGQTTDLELSITTMREDILALQICIRDRALAVSTSAAIVSDQNILQSIRQEEAAAEQDHHYARAMQNNRVPRPSGRNDPSPQENNFDDSISLIMGDLNQMTLSDRPDNGEGSSRRASPPQARISCVSCFDQFDETETFTSPCGDSLCEDCVRRLFLGSISDEELYPPRCCGQIIPPGTALRILDYRELQEFCKRAMEYSAKDRVYCAEPTCSKFIPSFAITADYGTCTECNRQTHLPCRSLAHPRVDCPMDHPLQDVLALADKKHWRRCRNCRAMVELNHGCHHITCRCGHQFCYVCGQKWKTCRCPQWQENRLLAVANEAVDDEVAPNADDVVRQNAFNGIVDELRRHGDVGCEHRSNLQWIWRNRGSLECDVCNTVMPQYIFVCGNCHMKACGHCRRHRLR